MHRILIMPSQGIVPRWSKKGSGPFAPSAGQTGLSEAVEYMGVLFRPKPGRAPGLARRINAWWAALGPGPMFEVLLRSRAGEHVRLSGGDDHLDGILDPIARVSERGGQIGQRKRVGVNLGRIEPLFRHQGHRPTGGAAAFATNAVD